MDEEHPTGNWSKGSDASLYFVTNWLWCLEMVTLISLDLTFLIYEMK